MGNGGDAVVFGAAGLALVFLASKAGKAKTGGSIPADIEAAAGRVLAFDDLSQVFLQRKPLFSYVHGGVRAGAYAFTITDTAGGTQENDNPQAFMSVTPMPDGSVRYEFGGHGPTISIYLDGEFKLTVPGSAGFVAQG